MSGRGAEYISRVTSGLPEPYESGEHEPAEPPEPPEPLAPRPSRRTRGVALALAVALGFVGAHRFYTGRVGTGVLMAVSLGGLGLWWLYDAIVVAAGEFRDAEGRVVWHWSRYQTGGPGLVEERRIEDLMDQIESVRVEVRELAERMDFAERFLAQSRERERHLPGRGAS